MYADRIASIAAVGYLEGMPYVIVNCNCGQKPRLFEDFIIACRYCGCDHETLYFAGLRKLTLENAEDY